MGSNVTHVAAIVCRDNKVLARQTATGEHADGWEFPGGSVEPGETSLQACKRHMLEEHGCRLSTTWLFNTVELDHADRHLVVDCFVSMPVPGSEPVAQANEALRWLRRDELPGMGWLPTSVEVVRCLGTFWDSVFMSEHM